MDTAFNDDLTGLFTRQYLTVRIGEEAARFTRFGDPVSLVLLDVDHFQALSDLVGRAGAEAVLQEIARLLRAHSRNCTILARYGGDKFALLLVHTPRAGALSYAERLKAVIEGHAFEHASVTVSAGVASLSEDATSVGDFMAKADQALYDAKRLGGNRVAAPTYAAFAQSRAALSPRPAESAGAADGTEAAEVRARASRPVPEEAVTSAVPVAAVSPEGQKSVGLRAHRCPSCNGRFVARSSSRGLGEWLILRFSRRRAYRCLACQHRFYDHPLAAPSP